MRKISKVEVSKSEDFIIMTAFELLEEIMAKVDATPEMSYILTRLEDAYTGEYCGAVKKAEAEDVDLIEMMSIALGYSAKEYAFYTDDEMFSLSLSSFDFDSVEDDEF